MGRFIHEEPTKNTAKMREWLNTDKGITYKERHKLYMREYRKKNGERVKEVKKAAMIRSRKEALAHYGKNGKLECVCCGESEWRFLQLDHKNNDGNLHRKKLKEKHGYNYTNMFYWAKKNNWPDIFQTLCANCNTAKSFYGQCPHKENSIQ